MHLIHLRLFHQSLQEQQWENDRSPLTVLGTWLAVGSLYLKFEMPLTVSILFLKGMWTLQSIYNVSLIVLILGNDLNYYFVK